MIFDILRMNKYTKIGLLITILLTILAFFTGCFEFLFLPYSFNFTLYHNSFPISLYFSSAVLMLGIGVGLVSVFVEKKKKYWFYGSIVIIVLGEGALGTFLGAANPVKLGTQIFNLNSFPGSFLETAIWNILYSLIAILTGPTIIGPYISLSRDIILTTCFFTQITTSYGYKGVILLLGMFHWYIETITICIACIAGIRVSLKSFRIFLSLKKSGFLNSLRKIKNIIIFEIVNTMPNVIILLIIAALLETLWVPFWINYWLTHIL